MLKLQSLVPNLQLTMFMYCRRNRNMWKELNERIPSRERMAGQRMSRELGQGVAVWLRMVLLFVVVEREDGKKRGTQGEEDSLSR